MSGCTTVQKLIRKGVFEKGDKYLRTMRLLNHIKSNKELVLSSTISWTKRDMSIKDQTDTLDSLGLLQVHITHVFIQVVA